MSDDKERSSYITRRDFLSKAVAATAAAAGLAAGSGMTLPEALATGEKSDASSPHVDAKNNIIETESLKINYGPYYWASQPPPYLPSYCIIQMMWKEQSRNLVRHLENWEYSAALNLGKKPSVFRKTKERIACANQT